MKFPQWKQNTLIQAATLYVVTTLLAALDRSVSYTGVGGGDWFYKLYWALIVPAVLLTVSWKLLSRFYSKSSQQVRVRFLATSSIVFIGFWGVANTFLLGNTLTLIQGIPESFSDYAFAWSWTAIIYCASQFIAIQLVPSLKPSKK